MSPSQRSNSHLGFWTLLALEWVFLFWIRGLGDLRQSLPSFFLLFAASVASYLAIIALVQKDRCPKIGLGSVLLKALFLRAALVGSTPSLSDDVYRYLFEGLLTLTGGNPFITPPISASLTALAPAIQPLVNHPEIPTVYPPFAQGIFMLIGMLGASVTAAQLIFIAFDLVTVAAIWSCLGSIGRPKKWVLAYALHPLPCLELGQSAHMDSLAIAPLALALAFFLKNNRAKSAFFAAFSTAGKLIGGFWLVFLALQGGKIRPLWPLVGIFLIGLSTLPFLDPAMLNGLETYASHWRFNDSLFYLVDWAVGSERSRWVVGGIFVGILLWLTQRGDPVDTILGATLAFFFLSPTAHPWYYLWVLPWLSLRFSWGLAFFGGLVTLSYHAHTTLDASGSWHPQAWVQWVEYGGLAVILLGEWALHLRRRFQ